MAKNRIGAGGDKKYVMVEGTTKNEKARKISLTKEALDVLKLLRTMGDCVAALPKLERYVFIRAWTSCHIIIVCLDCWKIMRVDRFCVGKAD